MELIHFKKNRNKVDLITQTFQEEQNLNDKLEHYNLKQIFDDKHKLKFVLYENLILDVSKYADDHPGGRNLIKDNFFSDISRYIVGNQGYSSKVSAYDHNLQTCVYAIKSLAYAKFIDDHRIVQINNKTTFLNNEMIFEYKHMIAESTYQLVFSHKSFQFPIFLPGISWFGRHFAVSSSELNKTRYYSLCLCMGKKMFDRANGLFKNIENLENKKPIDKQIIKETELYSNEISLFVKCYNFNNALSKYLNNRTNNTSSKINIRGPIVKNIQFILYFKSILNIKFL